MDQRVKEIFPKLNDAIISRDSLKLSLKNNRKSFKSNKKKLKNLLVIREILKKAAEIGQRNFQLRINEVVTSVIQTAFGPQYKFCAEFKTKYNKLSCDLVFKDVEGESLNILEESGGACADLCSFALRTAYREKLENNRRIFIFDEPFKCLDGLREKIIWDLMKSTSEKLGIQIILVSHYNSFKESADSLLSVERDHKKKISTIYTNEKNSY